MPKELCTIKYNDLDKAVKMCNQEGPGCHMAKSDMKSAFRNLPVKRKDWKWLVLMPIHPETHKK